MFDRYRHIFVLLSWLYANCPKEHKNAMKGGSGKNEPIYFEQ